MSKQTIKSFFEILSDKKFKFFEAKYINPQTEIETDVFGNMSIKFNDSNLTVMYGENASGKSFISNVLQQYCRAQKDTHISVRALSVANRTRSSIEKSMIFGDESEQSTGETSYSVTKLCLDSFKKDESKSIVILDEPDIGLSRKYSKAFAKYIVDIVNETDPNEKSIVIVSHNIDFIKVIIEYYGKPINHIGVNTEMSLIEWMNDDTEYSIEDLNILKKIGISKWRAIQSIINKK